MSLELGRNSSYVADGTGIPAPCVAPCTLVSQELWRALAFLSCLS